MFLFLLSLALMVGNIESTSLSMFSSDDNRNESTPTETAGHGIYAACETSFDCGRKLICTDFKCQCCKELYWNGTNCLTRKGQNQYCDSSSECMESLQCTETSCICADKDYWDGHTCAERKLLNDKCSLHFECQPTLSCARGYCQCPSSDYWNGSSCALRKIQNETCRLIHECRDTLQCKNKTCVCCKNDYWNGTFCITKKQIYSQCNSRIECAIGMYCCHGFCQLSSCFNDAEMSSSGSAFIITFTEPSHVKAQYLLFNTRSKGSLSQFTFSNNINKSITISHEHYLYHLPANVVMPTGISQNGAEIYSRIPKVMYGVQMSNGAGYTEGYMAIPLQYLSTSYIFPSFKAQRDSSITISSIYDNNKIQINLKMEKEPLTYMGVTYKNNDNITVLINKHYSFKLSHTSDLSGTMVSTSKPVSVLSSSKCAMIAGGGCCNELLETVLPINQLDQTYIIPEIETRPKSSVRIFCTKNTTMKVSFQNKVMEKVLLAQDEFEFIHERVSHVQANNDVLVMLYAHDNANGSVFMMTIQGRNQYLSDFHFVVPDNFKSYISVTVISEALDGFSLDGELITIRSAYNIHDGAEYYSTFSLSVTAGNHNMKHARGVRFGLWIYGQNTNCDSYGYPAGIAFKTL